MIKFKVFKTNEMKTAYSYRFEDDKVHIKFSESGKEYHYSKKSIEIADVETHDDLPFIVYAFEQECYKCHKKTQILTYITFDDGTNDNLIFPWDFKRLLKHQNVFAHIEDPSIEYYGLNVIGDVGEYDNLLMEKYPLKIQNRYSKTKKKTYPMNICEHCGSKQGWYFIYRHVNELIKLKKEIKTCNK